MIRAASSDAALIITCVDAEADNEHFDGKTTE
jgi:hypothetical protein